MNNFFCVYFIFLFFIFYSAGTIYGQRAQEIVARADKQFRGESSKATMKMSIVRPDWTRTLTMRSWSKGDEYSLILITAPPRDKGTAFLKRGNEVWQWLPSIQRTIKIPPSMMMQSWMGSDFTNDDLVREASIVEDYTHEILADTVIDSQPAWKIKMVPKPDAPVVWGKVIVFITKENYIQRRMEFYDEQEERINVMRLYDIKEMDGRLIPTTLEMIPVNEKGKKTVIQYESIDFNIPIDNSFFSLQNLRQIK